MHDARRWLACIRQAALQRALRLDEPPNRLSDTGATVEFHQ
jgi:hypothetical protein